MCLSASLDMVNPRIHKPAGTAQATVVTDLSLGFLSFRSSVVHYSTEVFHIWSSMLSDDIEGK